MNTESRMIACVKELVAAAREIARDDVEFRALGFEDFARVMYDDEDTRHRHDLDREHFSDALREAFDEFKQNNQ